MDVKFQEGFELDEDDLASVFFYADCDGKPVQIRVDEGALMEAAPGSYRQEDAADQFLDSRGRFEEIAKHLIESGRARGGYLEITAGDLR
jgi:hypothetical protein